MSILQIGQFVGYKYNSSNKINNLNDVIKICDEINVYDNTEILREIIYLKQGKIVWRDKNTLNWTKNILRK